MSDSEASPLLPKDKGKGKAATDGASDERTPLLAGTSTAARSPSRASSTRSSTDSRKGAKQNTTRQWPSIVAISLLALSTVAILLGAFFVPAAVETYAKQAAVIEPTNLSLESLTANGVRARIQANFRLDSSRVGDETARRVGRWATWIVRQLGTEETQVAVYLPQYDNVLLGTGTLPPLAISIVDGYNTAVDFVAELVPGDADGIRTIANDFLQGKVDELRLLGKADIRLKSGIISLGTHSVVESLVVEGKSLYQSFATLYFGEKRLQSI
jgi:hypothetical protein